MLRETMSKEVARSMSPGGVINVTSVETEEPWGFGGPHGMRKS